MRERTLTIFKPDSVARHVCGSLVARLEQEGFSILAVRSLRLGESQAQTFYEVHRERPFFRDLVRFMTEGPVWVLALERDNAVDHLRRVMGATNPAEADKGTIRAEFGTSIERNAIHGSDSVDNAKRELAFFFSSGDLV